MKYRSHGPRIYIAMWLRSHRYEVRRVLQCLGVACAVLYVCQLLYPANRTLPFVRAGNEKVGSQSNTQAAATVAAAYKQARFTIATDDMRFTKNLADLGGRAAAKTAAAKAADYPFAARLVPFSSLYIMATRDTPVYATFSGAQLASFAAQTEKDAHRDAVNATVAIKDNRAHVAAAVPSKTYTAKDTESRLRSAAYMDGDTIHLRPQTTPATRTSTQVQPLADKANQVITTPPKLVIAGRVVKPKGADVAAWLKFVETQEGSLAMALKEDVVGSYITKAQGDTYVAPGKTTIRTVDDREVSRQEGTVGKGVAIPLVLPKLLAAIESGTQQTVDLAAGDLAPTIVYDRVVSNVDPELTGAVQGQATAKGGFGIAVMEMNGRSSNANGDKQFIAASTYKLYVSYAWFKRVEAGKARWSDTINGRSADKCFEVMIVNSDNPCAKAFATVVGGWDAVDSAMRQIGLRHTSLATTNLYTTANDLAYFMYRLENGTLVPAADRTRLIDLMKRQKYRDGIPAGAGVTTADKVGFVDGYLNDAGIVYGAKHTYIMVVMSYGSSWSQIADAVKQIHSHLQ